MDDDAVVETADDYEVVHEDSVHPERLQEELPGGVYDVFDQVSSVLANYGWFIIVGVCALAYLSNKYLPEYNRWKNRREDQRRTGAHHKDPDALLSRQEAMELARRRMQEAHDAKVAEHAVKLKEQEEKKRLQKIEEWNNLQSGKGYHSKSKVAENETASSSTSTTIKKPAAKKGLRPEYNPLMGSGGGAPSCFRPGGSSRRGGSSGG